MCVSEDSKVRTVAEKSANGLPHEAFPRLGEPSASTLSLHV